MGKKRLLKQTKNILIIRNGALGDCILTLPVITSLKKAFPEAYIKVMGNPTILTLMQNQLDGTIPNNILGLYTLYGKGGNIPENIKQELGSFDLAISYSPDPDGFFIQNLKKIGIPRVINGALPPVDKLQTPITELLLAPLKKEGIPVSFDPPQIVPSFLDREMAEIFFQSANNSGKERQPIVAIHPGSGSPKKCWPKEKFAEIIKWAKKNLEATILLISGPTDKPITQGIMPLLKGYYTIMAEDLPLTLLSAILERCTVYVGNDSGVTHLAGAVGVPTLALFGPTDFQIWGPKNEKVKCLHPLYPCSPCSPKQMAACSHPACLESLSVATVKKSLLSLLPRFYIPFLNHKSNNSIREISYYV